MSLYDSEIEKAAQGNDLALVDATTGTASQITHLCDSIMDEDEASGLITTSAATIKDLAQTLAKGATAWNAAKQDDINPTQFGRAALQDALFEARELSKQVSRLAKTAAGLLDLQPDSNDGDVFALTVQEMNEKAETLGKCIGGTLEDVEAITGLPSTGKTARAVAKIARIMEGAQTAEQAESEQHQETAAEHSETEAEATEEPAGRDDKAVRKLRALELCVMRLSSVFTQVIPIAKADKINDDPDGFMMLLEKGEEAAEMAFYIACDSGQHPFGIDISETEEEVLKREETGEPHPYFMAFDTVRAEFLEMIHTLQSERGAQAA